MNQKNNQKYTHLIISLDGTSGKIFYQGLPVLIQDSWTIHGTKEKSNYRESDLWGHALFSEFEDENPPTFEYSELKYLTHHAKN